MAGDENWKSEGMAPYFKKFHNYQGPSPELKKRMMMDWVDEKAQGYDGPLPASFTDELGPFVSGSILVPSMRFQNAFNLRHGVIWMGKNILSPKS